MTIRQIELNTEKALESCRESIAEGTLTSFAECIFFLSGYTKDGAVKMTTIVDTVQKWVREGLIKDAWGC